MNMRRHAMLVVALVALATVAASGWSGAQSVRVGQAAPEVTGGGGWINSPPLSMAELKGRVVLVEFWTYG